jgi:acyl CoA:acetate/3-ketoacid CoA transferase beta subunit
VVQPVDARAGGQRQHFHKLRGVEGVANALGILRVGQFGRADDLAIVVIGGRRVRGVDGQVGDAGDFRPGWRGLRGGGDGEGNEKSGGK